MWIYTWKSFPVGVFSSTSVGVELQLKPIFLATLIRKSLHSDSHLPLIITIWNHSAWQGRRESRGPCQHFYHKLSNCHAESAAAVRRTQHQCVNWIQDPIINKFSIFSPSGAFANIKGGKGWCGIAVCLCLLLYKAARLSAPRHRRGAAEEIQFHDFHVSTWQVGLWFTRFVFLAYTWVWADHNSLKA